MAELLADAKTQADRARAAGAERVDEGVRVGLHARYQRLLADGHAANPPPPPGRRRRGRARRSPAANLLGGWTPIRLRSAVPGRPAGAVRHNQAERDLRIVKLQQKISGCWRALTGAQAFLTVRSYVSTARKHDMNPLAVLRQLFQGDPWLPAPVAA